MLLNQTKFPHIWLLSELSTFECSSFTWSQNWKSVSGSNQQSVASFKMKNCLVAIIALVYFGASSGVTLRLHYCMGKLADWGIGLDKSDACSKCGMAKSGINPGGCCNDENTIIKIASDQKIAESSFQQIQAIALAVPIPFLQIPEAACTTITEENPVSNAPPRSSNTAIYLRNCTFLI